MIRWQFDSWPWRFPAAAVAGCDFSAGDVSVLLPGGPQRRLPEAPRRVPIASLAGFLPRYGKPKSHTRVSVVDYSPAAFDAPSQKQILRRNNASS